MISIKKSENIFKFGGGTRRKSVGMFSIPCSLAGKNIVLITDVVQQDDLPCLLSKDSLKRAGAKIDIAEDQIEIFGQWIELKTNKSGHYTIKLDDLVHEVSPQEEFKVLWQILDGECKDEDFRKLLDMLEGLGHPGRKKFEQMLRITGNYSENIRILLNKLYEQCVTCRF